MSERGASGLRAAAALLLLAARSAAAQDAYPVDMMQARYPAWPPETRDSIFHHLWALDLF